MPVDIPAAAVPPEDAPALLDDIVLWIRRFVALPNDQAVDAVALWIAHTYVVRCSETTPRLAFLSPEPGSGKSRALEVIEALVADPILTMNASVSYLFRRMYVEDGEPLPTVLFDEVDTVFGRNAGNDKDDLRGILNSGYRTGATTGRVAVRGKEMIAEEWPTFCPVALAGLDDLPDTIMTRAIVVRMRRRAPNEQIEPYRRRTTATTALQLKERLARWATDARPLLTDALPELPPSVVDRNADVWEPLIAIGDQVGGEWPTRARAAAEQFIQEQSDRPATLGIRLLSDIRDVLGDRHAISTANLLGELNAIDTSPWAGLLHGDPIDARYLARTLKKYDIPTGNTVRTEDGVAKGYLGSHFFDAWSRYLPPQDTEPVDTQPPLLDDEEPF